MKTLVVIILMIMNVNMYAQHDHSAPSGTSDQKTAPIFKDEKVATAYAHYIQLKDALVAFDGKKASKAAGELEMALGKISSGSIARKAAKTISGSNDVNTQRMAFVVLSDEITTLVKSSRLESGTLFIAYCPMANNSEGAYWLSNEKDIRNPYFGAAMLKCGTIKETIQ